MTFSKRAIYGSKKSRFIKDEEAKGPLSNSGVRTPVSKESTNIRLYFILKCKFI